MPKTSYKLDGQLQNFNDEYSGNNFGLIMITLALRAAESALTWAGVLGRTFAELEVLVSSLSIDMDLPTGLLGFLARKSRSLKRIPTFKIGKKKRKGTERIKLSKTYYIGQSHCGVGFV